MIINITGIPRERNNLQIYPAPCITTNIPTISSSPSTSSALPINLTSIPKLPIFRHQITIENIQSTSINTENIHSIIKKAPSPSDNARKRKSKVELGINK